MRIRPGSAPAKGTHPQCGKDRISRCVVHVLPLWLLSCGHVVALAQLDDDYRSCRADGARWPLCEFVSTRDPPCTRGHAIGSAGRSEEAKGAASAAPTSLSIFPAGF